MPPLVALFLVAFDDIKGLLISYTQGRDFVFAFGIRNLVHLDRTFSLQSLQRRTGSKVRVPKIRQIPKKGGDTHETAPPIETLLVVRKLVKEFKFSDFLLPTERGLDN